MSDSRFKRLDAAPEQYYQGNFAQSIQDSAFSTNFFNEWGAMTWPASEHSWDVHQRRFTRLRVDKVWRQIIPGLRS